MESASGLDVYKRQTIADPENAADYQFLQEKCAELEQLKAQHEAAMEEWLLLEEG